MYTVHLLPASFGDSILIEYGPAAKAHYILIDGGPYFNFSEMIKGLKRIAPKLKELELLVITHIDIDHIDGIITLLNQDTPPFKIKEVWFNGYKELTKIKDNLLGTLQGEYLSKVIESKKFKHNTSFKRKAVMVKDHINLPQISLPGGMKITLLSPAMQVLQQQKIKWETEMREIEKKETVEKRWKKDHRYDDVIYALLGTNIEKWQGSEPKKDTSLANKSSIAFMGTYGGKRCLFAGDATSDSLLESIVPLLASTGKERLTLDAWKLAHHGSKGSTLDKLMSKIECKRMLISTNGNNYNHPDPECLAKLLKHNGPNLSFYFNYYSEQNKKWADKQWQKKYRFKSFYPEDKDGISIQLK
jgi:beta-lactamase superfamily II metal-dependent hydrolase